MDGAREGCAPCQTSAVAARFLSLADVAESLSISASQAYALVHSGALPAIQVGGRGQWRVETSVLEEYIQARYAENRARLGAQPAGAPAPGAPAASPEQPA